MEGITYLYDLDIGQIKYVIFPDEGICCVEGICFIKHGNKHFGLEAKTEKFAPIINDALNNLKDINRKLY